MEPEKTLWKRFLIASKSHKSTADPLGPWSAYPHKSAKRCDSSRWVRYCGFFRISGSPTSAIGIISGYTVGFCAILDLSPVCRYQIEPSGTIPLILEGSVSHLAETVKEYGTGQGILGFSFAQTDLGPQYLTWPSFSPSGR